MDRSLRKTADAIVRAGIEAVLPDAAVARALERFDPGGGRVVLVAAGKAAWQMARAALDCLGHVDAGIVITKYGHVRGELPGVVCCEAGHPVPDQAGFDATRRALALVQGLAARDRVLFLLSGGGSALLEQPLLPAGQLQDITRQLLACGADIVEINTIRKRLSAVKGGRFALNCAPARVFSVVLSDILGDPLDMIASGPACPDRSTCAEAAAIAAKYALRLSPQARALLARETPQVPGQRHHLHHRQRAAAVPRRRRSLRGPGVSAGAAHRLPLLRGPGGGTVPGGHDPHPTPGRASGWLFWPAGRRWCI